MRPCPSRAYAVGAHVVETVHRKRACMWVRQECALGSMDRGGTVIQRGGLGRAKGVGDTGGRRRPCVRRRAAAADGMTPAPTDVSIRRVLARMKDVVLFAIPILMVPIADPLMSLIDVVFLGQFSSSLNVAGLSPATLIFNFAFYSFTALTIATVATVADRLRQGKDDEAGRVLSTSLILGVAAGGLVALFLKVGNVALLRMTACESVLLPIASQYLSIRAWAFPAAIATSVLQGSFIAQRDSGTPFKIVLTSIVLSALGDYVLISRGFGIAAAAWTTLLSQYFSAAVLLFRSVSRESKVRPRFIIPDPQETLDLVKYVGTLGVFYVAKTSSYLFLQSAATRLPAMEVAAHQSCWSLWGLCSFTSAPLEQASLAFLPTARPGREKNELTVALVACGACLGVLCTFIAVGIPVFFPFLLTSDTTLYPVMRSVATPGIISMLCCGFDVTSTGVLLANRDTAYVARAMVISLLVLVAFLTFNAYTSGFTISNVWYGLASFFGSRVVQSLPRVFRGHLK
jgi:putative MATE family efflux protein